MVGRMANIIANDIALSPYSKKLFKRDEALISSHFKDRSN